jgi:hypothetical protein
VGHLYVSILGKSFDNIFETKRSTHVRRNLSGSFDQLHIPNNAFFGKFYLIDARSYNLCAFNLYGILGWGLFLLSASVNTNSANQANQANQYAERVHSGIDCSCRHTLAQYARMLTKVNYTFKSPQGVVNIEGLDLGQFPQSLTEEPSSLGRCFPGARFLFFNPDDFPGVIDVAGSFNP